MTETKITPQPEYDALYAFDAENNIEPASVIAERIAAKYGFNETHSLVDDIHYAIEDAMELGQRRGRLIPPRIPDAAQAQSKCDCAVMCQDLGIQGGCRYIKPSRTMLRKLVDLTWNHVTESQEVPSTNLADELIDRASLVSSTNRECPFCSRRVFEPCQSIAQAQNACTLSSTDKSGAA